MWCFVVVALALEIFLYRKNKKNDVLRRGATVKRAAEQSGGGGAPKRDPETIGGEKKKKRKEKSPTHPHESLGGAHTILKSSLSDSGNLPMISFATREQ